MRFVRCFLLFLLCLVFLSPDLKSQILPAEGSDLNYRIAGFSFPAAPGAHEYIIEIAAGNIFSEDSFRKNTIKRVSTAENRLVAELPYFGYSYTWRVVRLYKLNKKSNTPFYHFTTGTCPNVDTSLYRLRVVKPASAYKDAFVFLDDSKTLCDMNGIPVWYLPKVAGLNITPRDIKLTSQGTITFLFNPPFEINYNGEVLWRVLQKSTISGDRTENFHHEFTRLRNGHYMVLGTQYVYWKQKKGVSRNYKTAPGDDTLYKKTPFGTIIEYDEQGKIVWSWKSADYFTSSDIINYDASGTQPVDVHENAFFFDEEQKVIYVSYRNINKVLKLKYPEGVVLASYGETYKPGMPETGSGLFCGQHSCNIARNGNLYLFNNNICDPIGLPKLIMMKEAEDSLEKVWEYQCTVEHMPGKVIRNYRFISGGSVQELPDQSLFACMNGTYSKVFIVSKEKEVLWSAVTERWNTADKKWDMSGQYRAYLITRQQLEQLIWNAAKQPRDTSEGDE